MDQWLRRCGGGGGISDDGRLSLKASSYQVLDKVCGCALALTLNAVVFVLRVGGGEVHDQNLKLPWERADTICRDPFLSRHARAMAVFTLPCFPKWFGFQIVCFANVPAKRYPAAVANGGEAARDGSGMNMGAHGQGSFMINFGFALPLFRYFTSLKMLWRLQRIFDNPADIGRNLDSANVRAINIKRPKLWTLG